MMVATRFGLRFEAPAHSEIEWAQYWTSILKMGEMAVDTELEGVSMGRRFVFQAKDARIALTNKAASGTIVKSDKQPPP